MARILIVAALTAALAGCAPPQQQASLQSLQNRRDLLRADLHRNAVAPYEQWTRETPLSCASPQLLKARDTVLFIASITDAKTQGFDSALEAGVWALDVADGVNARGCGEVAREIYKKVISIYIGTAYAGLRDRAMVGLSEAEYSSRQGVPSSAPPPLPPVSDLSNPIDPGAVRLPFADLSVAPLSSAAMDLFSKNMKREGPPKTPYGVVVVAVGAGSMAAQRGIAIGDIILEVAQSEVHSPSDMVRKINDYREAGKQSILVLELKASGLHFVALPLR
jgi:hypothetical protein